ncbi:unnamed protein product [Tetraodon nigroviridis]|uniref:(spotted green pufferfish) hypothetical protein n=1 Tax=Tetraodon nigroviridis TaxID=99883 RepID=Q4RHV1_TETNG|nr:unnamed protein product [Tetraodon nigroviridis]
MTELMQDHLPIHLTDLAKRYGNIYRLKCGNTSHKTQNALLCFSAAMVVLSSGDVIREALVKKWSDFAGRSVSYTADIVSGGGRTISLGDYTEEWKAHRRLVHSALQRCCKQSLHDVIERQALQLRKVLINYQGGAVDLSEDFTVAASNVITTLVFGKEKFPNPVFSRLLREVTRRDEIIRKHLNQYKVQIRPMIETP